jgi:hypothetical protein
MDYTKYVKGVSGVSALRLALWAVLIAAALAAGIALLGSGLS